MTATSEKRILKAIRSADTLVSAPAGPAPSPAPCIAVLPFENFSGSPDHDYFSIGVVEDLITDLSHFANLQVISSYTSRKMTGAAGGAVAEARRLGVGYLLRGNLRRSGGGIRISAQLSDAYADNVIWAERYDASQDTLFDIQDDIVARVAGALSAHIDNTRLTMARRKPITSLAAYDCWLRGMDRMRQGSPAADAEARDIFHQALSIDPGYARAHAGLSLSYFNDWSCQVWDRWEETEKNAYKHAIKAVQLDDTDHVVQYILGRILLFRRQFDAAEQHVDCSLRLNANDADILAQAASSYAYLGRAVDGQRLFEKALRLNPYRNAWYYPHGALTHFVQQQYTVFAELALKGPLTEVWIDLPAYLAAAYAHTGDAETARRYLDIFVQAFTASVTGGMDPSTGDITSWIKLANPYKAAEHTDVLLEGLRLAGLDGGGAGDNDGIGPAPPTEAAFTLSDGFWQIAFAGEKARVPDMKGCHDLAVLMATPDEEVHCMTLMGGGVTGSGVGEPVIDDTARRAYQARISELRKDIAEADAMNDIIRRERFAAELDQLTEHLGRAMGLGGRLRTMDPATERARAAVTLRIRNAIKKIETAHPALGRHLGHSIRTGTFCIYAPEHAVAWKL